eukprot:GHUV01033889.1.p2 GENE.GHUV01033889.1~~GHUV01033889.1.p2  ORF type:complete len:131 (+),score=28.00 GHUV01033889.1:580-972(+)
MTLSGWLTSVLMYVVYADELRKREKAAGIQPDPEIDAWLKAEAVSGKQHNIVTDLILRILGLEVSRKEASNGTAAVQQSVQVCICPTCVRHVHLHQCLLKPAASLPVLLLAVASPQHRMLPPPVCRAGVC